ncbi:transcription factor Tfb4-domain-containing protein [Amanita rubescens]|nr:transcription factor Tfb4-domain-containing protein [Amanita rubescens]
MNDSRGSHLSVILDLSPSQWHSSAIYSPPLSLASFLSQLLTFLNSHIACKHENTLAVFGALPGKSVILYSSTNPLNDPPPADANSYPSFKLVDTAVVAHIAEELDALGEPEEEEPVALVSALTKALCYINRITLPPAPLPGKKSGSLDSPVLSDPRILILSVSPDHATSYIPIMNSIFSAQKLKVTIDVCQVYGPETVFLQQAAHLTGGSYIQPERRPALLQYLIMSFLSPPSMRKVLSVPTQDKIDFRAACFCHKTIVDIGFVCSVCLSIFCQPVPVCSTCRTKFPIKTLQRLNASRPPPPSASNVTRSVPGTPQPRAVHPPPGTPTTPTLGQPTSTNGTSPSQLTPGRSGLSQSTT